MERHEHPTGAMIEMLPRPEWGTSRSVTEIDRYKLETFQKRRRKQEEQERVVCSYQERREIPAEECRCLYVLPESQNYRNVVAEFERTTPRRM